MNKCQGLFGMLFGHTYKARHDVLPPNAGFKCGSGPDWAVLEMTEKFRSKIYRGDVCKRCGHIVNSPKEQA